MKSFEEVCGRILVEDDKFAPLINSFRVNIPLDNKQVIEDSFESHICHELLQEVDSSMASYLHSNDKRKIVNALFKYFKQRPISELATSANQTSLIMRYCPILIWIKADKAVLE